MLDFWKEKTREIGYLLKHDCIKNFLQWEPIVSTMYPPTIFGNGQMNPNTIRQAEWLRKENVDISLIRESPIGNPLPYFEYSANFVQQASQCALLAKMVDLSKYKHIVEFGGGFGGFNRVFRLLGYQHDYTIFDLPELNELQKYYLGENKILHRCNVTNNEDDLPDGNGVLLFSMFALAETDTEQRNRWLDRYPNCFVSYCPTFENIINNDGWFEGRFQGVDHTIRKNFLGGMGRFLAKTG